jgi:RNA polymerase sigma-70 factor, ECF subfamily
VPVSILHAAASGDSAAVRSCIATFGGLVWSLARRHSPTQADAEDAAQEIFLDLWRSGARFDDSRSTEVAFVAMVARRRLIDRIRARKRRPETETLESDAPMRVEARGDLCVEAARAATAIESLRPEQREVLLMSAVEGLSHEEIATIRGLPLGTVKSHARRALIRVRQALVDDSERANAQEEPT